MHWGLIQLVSRLLVKIVGFHESSWWFIILGVFGGTAIGILGVCVPFIAVTKKGASLPFIPATEWQMKNIESGITRHVTDRSNFIDIGSGDGRITLLGADYFDKSQGIEINRWLVYYSALKGEVSILIRDLQTNHWSPRIGLFVVGILSFIS